jgi:23S rRNA (adenine2503-C2)-methyltransferase
MIEHSLTANEDRVNIVMMGQGEPLLNLANVIKVTRLLTDPEGMAISPRRITLLDLGNHSEDCRAGPRASSS